MDVAVNQRVKFVATNKGITQYRLAKVLGLSTSAINNIFMDKNGVSVETLSKIVLTYQDINAYWLLTGQGEPFNAPQTGKVVTMNEGIRPPAIAARTRKPAKQKIVNEAVTDDFAKKGYPYKEDKYLKIISLPMINCGSNNNSLWRQQKNRAS